MAGCASCTVAEGDGPRCLLGHPRTGALLAPSWHTSGHARCGSGHKAFEPTWKIMQRAAHPRRGQRRGLSDSQQLQRLPPPLRAPRRPLDREGAVHLLRPASGPNRRSYSERAAHLLQEPALFLCGLAGAPPRHARAARTNQRIPPTTSQVGTTFPSRQNFYFWNGGLPPAFSSGISSRPHDPAYSTAGGLFLRGGGRPEVHSTGAISGREEGYLRACSRIAVEVWTKPDHS
jgi:hypothetical protein